MTEGRREKIKLRANYFNAIAVVIISIGSITPIYVAFQSLDKIRLAASLFVAIISWNISIRIHEYAQKILSQLDTDQEHK